jgi:multiple sugar transport system substrate-binding protein
MKKLTDYLGKIKSSSFKYSFSATLIILLVIILELYLIIPIYKTSKEKKGTTEIYFATNFSNAHQKIINRYNELHAGKIKVISIDLPFKVYNTNERKELLIRSLRNKPDRMDLFEVDIIWVKRFAKWCLDLGEFFPINERNKFLSNALISCYEDSSLVALPHYFDIGILYYRDDLLSKMPGYESLKQKLNHSITWKEFIELSRYFNTDKHPFYIFSAEEYEGLVCSFIESILSQNRDFFNQDKIDLTRPESIKALTTLVNFVSNSTVSPKEVLNFNENSGYEYFLKNDGLFFRGWPNFLKDHKNLYQDEAKTRYLVKAALPHFEGNDPGFIIGGWNIMVSKYTDKKNEVGEFLKFLVSDEAQKILYDEGGYLPTLQKFYEDSLYLNIFPELRFIKYLQNYGVHRPLIKDYTRISDIISHYVHRAINGDLSVNVALKEATEMINSHNTILK